MRAQCQEERKTTFKDCYSSHCDPNWHTFLRIGATRLKAISPIRKNCVCLTSLYPLLKKEQDCQYTTQGSRLKCYSISLRYKIYQSLVLYFAFYIFQNKMKIHTYSLERYLEIDETNSIKLPNCP